MNSLRLGGLVFFCASLFYGWASFDIHLDFWSQQELFTARSLPLALALTGGLISLTAIIMGSQPDWHLPLELQWRPFFQVLLLMAVFSLSFEFLGFYLASLLFLGSGSFILGTRKPWALCLPPLLVVSVFGGLMFALDIYLEPGQWWHWLLNEDLAS